MNTLSSSRIKTIKVSPQMLICYLFLAAILAVCISALPVKEDTSYDTHTLTWKDMKEYQVEITAHHAIFYDYDRVVGVLNLDERDCQLTKLVEADNE